MASARSFQSSLSPDTEQWQHPQHASIADNRGAVPGTTTASSANKNQLRSASAAVTGGAASAAEPGQQDRATASTGNLEHYRHRVNTNTNDTQCNDRSELTNPTLSFSRPATISDQRPTAKNNLRNASNPTSANRHVLSSSPKKHSQPQQLPPTARRDMSVLPSVLPPPPKVVSVSRTPASTDMSDFITMSTNYLSMLNSKNDDGDTAQEDNADPVYDDMLQDPAAATPGYLASPEFAMSPLVVPADFTSPSHQGYLTSPLFSSVSDFLTSPGEDTPFSQFLPTPNLGGQREFENGPDDTPLTAFDGTPIMDNNFGCFDDSTSPLIEYYGDSFGGGGDVSDMALFANPAVASQYNNYTDEGIIAAWTASNNKPPASAIDPPRNGAVSTTDATSAAAPLDFSQMLTMSPQALHNDEFFPSQPARTTSQTQPAPLPSSATRRLTRSANSTRHNGTRKNVTPETLIPVDAPIQKRNYTAPTATSRKPTSRAASRKRTRAQLDEDELAEDAQHDLDDLMDPSTIDRSKLSVDEYKRLQNTLAARKSRKRKLQHLRELENKIDDIGADRDVWKTRAMMMRDLLRANGVEVPDF